MVRSTGISSKLSSETTVTSVAPPRSAARAESSASFSAGVGLGADSERRRQLGLAADAQRRASGVERDEAAADHDHATAEIDAVAAIDVEEVVDRLDDAVELDAGNLQIASARHADRQEHRLESLRAQFAQAEDGGERRIRAAASRRARGSCRSRRGAGVRGSRYSGMPKRIMPPGSAAASKTVTS